MSVHTIPEDCVGQDQSVLDNFRWMHHTGGSEAFLQCLQNQQQKAKGWETIVLLRLKVNHSLGKTKSESFSSFTIYYGN